MPSSEKCERCGVPLPKSRTNNRKYCAECGKIVNRERTRARNAENNKLMANENREMRAARLAEKAATAKTLRAADIAYCKKCFYHGSWTESYLCDYFCMTGERRGCKAGVGCRKRKLRGNVTNGKRVCQRCGAKYDGGDRSRYCDECRAIVKRENAKRRWKEYGGFGRREK